MSAGYIQLAAIGQQDAYLTGKPEVTYFSGVYKRHTPFVLEAYDIPFQGQQVLYGSLNICKIPPKGDLIRGLTLKMNLPALANPGNNWTWPDPSSISYLPHFIVSNLGGVRSYTEVPLLGNVSYYSTINSPSWLTGDLNYYVSYDSVTNQFTFSNCLSVEVDTTFGVFWGFDPKVGTNNASNLVYTVSGSRPADFTLEQSGWLQSPGIIDPKTGLFLQAVGSQAVGTTRSYLYLTDERSVPPGVWNNYYPKLTAFIVTPSGRVRFGGRGYYMLRASINLDVGSLATISYGSTSVDGVPSGTPTYTYTYTCRVSPDPSMPIVLPINVNDASQYYYFYVTSSVGAVILPGSWISINPVEEFYKFNNSSTALSAQYSRAPFYGASTPQNAIMALATDSSFSFPGGTGMYLASGSIALVNPAPGQYVSNVSISNVNSISNVLFSYDMSSQGRDPTFFFSMPIQVRSTSDKFAFNIGLTSGTSATLDASTFVAFSQFGVYPGTQSGYVLPYNGLLLNAPVPQVLNGDVNINTDYTTTGNSYLISITSQNSVLFSNTGVYMMTATISGTSPISRVSFGTTSYNVGVGLLPPYTFTLPLDVTTPFSTANISIISTSGATQTLGANSFITVYPVASNTIQTINYNYNDSVGSWAIKSAELKIGGQSIQTLTGEYIELWNDLNVPYENQSGLTLLTGKYDTTNVYSARTYYTNLPFYFYGNPELSIPITALDRQDVEVWVTFRNFTELASISLPNPTLDATILVEYVYLSEPEINWFKSHRLDYLITQCQYQNFDLLPFFRSAIFQLKLLNPVRELFFVVQPTTNPNYDYMNNGLSSLALTLNGAEAFTADTTDTLFLGSLQPFVHYPNYPSRRFYMYPFTTDPGSPKPRGHINMSRIRQILLELKTEPYYQAKQLRVMAVSYNVLRIENGMAGIMFNSGTQSV
jgi:hypothetical protein